MIKNMFAKEIAQQSPPWYVNKNNKNSFKSSRYEKVKIISIYF